MKKLVSLVLALMLMRAGMRIPDSDFPIFHDDDDD